MITSSKCLSSSYCYYFIGAPCIFYSRLSPIWIGDLLCSSGYFFIFVDASSYGWNLTVDVDSRAGFRTPAWETRQRRVGFLKSSPLVASSCLQYRKTCWAEGGCSWFPDLSCSNFPFLRPDRIHRKMVRWICEVCNEAHHRARIFRASHTWLSVIRCASCQYLWSYSRPWLHAISYEAIWRLC